MFLKSVYLSSNFIFLIAKNQLLANRIKYVNINQIDEIVNLNKRI